MDDWTSRQLPSCLTPYRASEFSHRRGAHLWAGPSFPAASGPVRVPEAPDLGVTLDSGAFWYGSSKPACRRSMRGPRPLLSGAGPTLLWDGAPHGYSEVPQSMQAFLVPILFDRFNPDSLRRHQVMTSMTGTRYLAEALHGYGITHFFFMPVIVPAAMPDFERLGIAPIMTHAEKSAAYMADAYARVRRGPAVWRPIGRSGQPRRRAARRLPWMLTGNCPE